ncbi:hypothetical protein ACA910_021536 [Epithemia clementina (nom. ined.)]
MVKSAVDMIGDDSATRFLDIEGNLGEIEHKLSILKVFLGDRPDNLGTSTVFEMLERLMDSLVASTAGQQQAVRFHDPAPSSPALSEFSSRFASLERDFRSFKSTITGTVYSEIKKS